MIIKRLNGGNTVRKNRVNRQDVKKRMKQRMEQRKKKGCGCGRKKK